MTHQPDADVTEDRPTWHAPKERHCLRCSETFTSAWSGERICPRCKSSSAWRSGMPHQSGSSSGRDR